MAELRRDPTTRTWVIAGGIQKAEPGPGAAGEACPFCEDPGPRIIARAADGRGGWQACAIPDRNPVFRAELAHDRAGVGMYDRMNNVGAHEVVIESRRHDASWGNLGREELGPVLGLYADRVRDLKNDVRFRHIFILKTVGREAGSLIAHPHGHVVAAPVMPPRIKQELVAAQNYFRRKERCVFCDMVRQETATGQRIVVENPRFLAICPYASRSPYEVWVFPRTHHAAFEEHLRVDPAAPGDLAELLASVVRRIGTVAGSHYVVLHNAPNTRAPSVKPRWETLQDDFHWHLEVAPRFPGHGHLVGEEVFPSNPVLPEDAAAVLRQAE